MTKPEPDRRGDWPVLNMNGRSLTQLKNLMALVQGFPAHGFAIDVDRNLIVFFKYADIEGATPFPVPLGYERCAEIAWDWLQSVTYPDEPDHDGDNAKGWRCFTEAWGQIETYGYASFLAVTPEWLMFGK